MEYAVIWAAAILVGTVWLAGTDEGTLGRQQKKMKIFEQLMMWVKPKRECKKCCLFCTWYEMCKDDIKAQRQKK